MRVQKSGNMAGASGQACEQHPRIRYSRHEGKDETWRRPVQGVFVAEKQAEAGQGNGG